MTERPLLATCTLALCAIFSGQPTFADGNDVAAILGLFAGMAQQQQADEAAKEWQAFPEPNRSCIVEGLNRSGNALEAVIEAGIAPDNPQLQQLRDHCASFMNFELSKNSSCEVQVDGRMFSSWCDEVLMGYDQNGQLVPVSPEQAVNYAYQSDGLQRQLQERMDAISRRTEMMAVSPDESTVPAPNFNCEKAETKSEMAICSSYVLAVLDAEFGGLYKRASQSNKEKSVKAAAIEEYEKTEACKGNVLCIRQSKEAAIEEIATLLRAGGVSVTTSLDLKRREEEKRRKQEEDRIAAEQEKARLAEEMKRKKLEEDRARKAAEDEEKRRKEQKKKELISSVDKSQAGGGFDLFLITNTKNAPNLASNLAGELVSVSGNVNICRFVGSGGRDGDIRDRYVAFIERRISGELPPDTTVTVVSSDRCADSSNFDYVFFQKAEISSTSLEVIELIAKADSAGLVVRRIANDDDAQRNEEQYLADVEARKLANNKLVERLTAGLAAGSVSGAGALSLSENSKDVCYVEESFLGAGENLDEALARLLASEAENAAKSASAAGDPQQKFDGLPKSFANLDQLFIELQKSDDACGFVVGSGADLAKLLPALERLQVAADVMPLWVEVAELASFSNRAKSAQAKLEAERAAAEERAAEEAAANSCERNWKKCKDNEDLVNNYRAMTGLQIKCQYAVDAAAKYGEPEWGGWLSIPFSTYVTGDSSLKDGVIILIDEEVKMQNSFGTYSRSEPRCTVDLDTGEIVDLTFP